MGARAARGRAAGGVGAAGCSHLQESSDLLLGNRGVILQRETVRPQRLHHLADARTRLHGGLALLDIDGDDLLDGTAAWQWAIVQCGLGAG